MEFLAPPVEGFAFKNKLGNIPWANLPENPIPGELDVLLEELSSAMIERPDLELIADPRALKVFKLSQLASEYLIYVKDKLQEIGGQYEHESSQLAQKNQNLKTEFEKNNVLIDGLKFELRNKRKKVMAYQDLLKEPIASHMLKEKVIKPKTFSCEFCSKVFISEDFLEQHKKRRHAPPPVKPMVFDAIQHMMTEQLYLVNQAHSRELQTIRESFQRELTVIQRTREEMEMRILQKNEKNSEFYNRIVQHETELEREQLRQQLNEQSDLIQQHEIQIKAIREANSQLNRNKNQLEMRFKELSNRKTMPIGSIIDRIEENERNVNSLKLTGIFEQDISGSSLDRSLIELPSLEKISIDQINTIKELPDEDKPPKKVDKNYTIETKDTKLFMKKEAFPVQKDLIIDKNEIASSRDQDSIFENIKNIHKIDMDLSSKEDSSILESKGLPEAETFRNQEYFALDGQETPSKEEEASPNFGGNIRSKEQNLVEIVPEKIEILEDPKLKESGNEEAISLGQNSGRPVEQSADKEVNILEFSSFGFVPENTELEQKIPSNEEMESGDKEKSIQKSNEDICEKGREDEEEKSIMTHEGKDKTDTEEMFNRSFQEAAIDIGIDLASESQYTFLVKEYLDYSRDWEAFTDQNERFFKNKKTGEVSETSPILMVYREKFKGIRDKNNRIFARTFKILNEPYVCKKSPHGKEYAISHFELPEWFNLRRLQFRNESNKTLDGDPEELESAIRSQALTNPEISKVWRPIIKKLDHVFNLPFLNATRNTNQGNFQDSQLFERRISQEYYAELPKEDLSQSNSSVDTPKFNES